MQLYQFDGNQVSKGVSMNVMAQLFMEASVANPKATLGDLSWVCVVEWKAGNGVAYLSFADGSQETQDFTQEEEQEAAYTSEHMIDDDEDDWLAPQESTKNVITLSEGDTVQLIPENGQPYTITAGKNTASVVMGLVNRSALISDPRESDTKEQALVRTWLREGEVGVSSKTMAHVLYGVPEDMSLSQYDGPSDPSDFRRCVEFLKAVPEARTRIKELEVIPGWEKIAKNFDELESLYNQEIQNASGKAPRLYERMQELRSGSSPNIKM